MSKAVDPVPEMYARAFSGIDSVRARLKELRARASAEPPAGDPVCSSPEETSDESPTVECTPAKARTTLDEFREMLAEIRTVLF